MPTTSVVEGIYITTDQGIERISELEDRNFEITQYEENKGKGIKKKKEQSKPMWSMEYYQMSQNSGSLGVQKEEKERRRQKAYLKK